MTIRRFMLMALILTYLSVVGMPSLAQDNEPITLLVDAGFDNFYRPGYWLPLQIQVRNEGVGFAGRLTVRPETSGRAVNSAYSVPIDLPTGSDKTVFLYIQAQQSSGTIIVELIDDEGVRFADQAVGLTAINPNDALHMVVSSTAASSIPLNTVAQAGFTARQGRWETDNIPSDVAALDAIDTLVLYDVPSDDFTIDQLQTLEAWVATGGHLIVVGGPSWAQTTSNLNENLLPFNATGSENINDISPISHYINADDTLTTRTFVTTGDVAENADVLAETENGLPLLLRREFGIGVSDFLTVDPTLEPLRSWTGLRDFWFTILATTSPEPSWSRGFLDLQDAARSIAILPNVELLPPASSMIIFIAAYIFMIGPINYFVLSRLGRRAWAWVTIPLLILTFTFLAWNVGFNLRGNEVIMSRLYVVQSFPDTDLAYQEQLVGVLSPRRETYTISAPNDALLGTLPGVEDDSLFSANVSRTTSEVSQGQPFIVEDIAIDGGIFANFSLSSIVTAPDISGQVTFGYRTETRTDDDALNEPTPLSIRGIVRNDSDMTLEDVVILTRNRFYRVEENFEPGDILDFDNSNFSYINETFYQLVPIASPLQSAATNDINVNLNTRRSLNETLVTSRVLLNLNWSTALNLRDDSELLNSGDEEFSRRRAFLRAFMRDQYATGGIGNQVYLIGWTSEQHPDDVTITDTPYRPVDTTLHIVELESEFELPPSGEIVTLSADQFTWATTDVAVGQVLGSFNDLTIINPGWADFAVMPLDGAILSDVSQMLVEVNRGTSLGRQMDIALWNFETREWDVLENTRIEEYIVENPASYLGNNNVVNMRVSIDTELISNNQNGRVLQLRVIQIGTF